MAAILRRRAFLERVSCRASGRPLSPLGLYTEFTRDNVEYACQALSLKLVGLEEDDDEGSYAFRITRAGMLLLDGQIEAAAALIDQGLRVKPITAAPPWGLLGSKLHPSGPGMALKGSGPRAYAPELILAIAAGHAVVLDDIVRGNVPRLGAAEPPGGESGRRRESASGYIRRWGQPDDRG